MYSFTDPRLLTVSSNSNNNTSSNNNSSNNNNKSPLLSPPTSFASMHPFFQVFGHLPAFSPFHPLSTASSHMHPSHNPFYHSSLRQSPVSHSNASNSVSLFILLATAVQVDVNDVNVCPSFVILFLQSNFFLFPHLPQHLQQPPQLSIPSSPNAPLQTSPLVISNVNANCTSSTPPATVSSTTSSSNNNNSNTPVSNGKVYYSNKRKEYEAREEKKAAFKSSIEPSNRLDHCNDSGVNTFSCPICLQGGFTGDTLKQHFELELKQFKHAEAVRNNKLNDNDIDVESVSFQLVPISFFNCT